MQISLEDYAARFDAYVGVEARALTLALVPLFFVAVTAVEGWRRRRLIDHVVFALHFCAWLLLWMLVVFGAWRLAVLVFEGSFARTHWSTMDHVLTLASHAVEAVYLYFALRTVYGGSRAAALGKALVLSAAVLVVIWGYRLFLFFVAFWRT